MVRLIRCMSSQLVSLVIYVYSLLRLYMCTQVISHCLLQYTQFSQPAHTSRLVGIVSPRVVSPRSPICPRQVSCLLPATTGRLYGYSPYPLSYSPIIYLSRFTSSTSSLGSPLISDRCLGSIHSVQLSLERGMNRTCSGSAYAISSMSMVNTIYHIKLIYFRSDRLASLITYILILFPFIYYYF